MPYAAVLATAGLLALLALAAVVVLLTRRRRRRPTEDGSAQDPHDADLPESMDVRVLRAQVHALEQALEEAETAAVLARLEAAEAREAAEVAVAPAAVEVVAVEVEEAAFESTAVEPAVAVAFAEVGHAAEPEEVVTAIASVPDVVLPVPPLPEPEVPRSHRWFRRSAA